MPAAAPFYWDWTFWAFVSSAVAVALSQLPPVKHWFRGAKLVVETPKQMRITHSAGFASAGIIISVRNVGGRATRVISLTFKLKRDGKPVLDIPITEFHPNPTAGAVLQLMPFTLPAGADWARSINGYQDLTRENNRKLEKFVSAVRHDIGRKALERDAAEQPSKELVVLDDALLKQALDLFEKNFIWTTGEYQLDIEIKTEDNCVVKQASRLFTVWESDEAELRSLVDDYKHGFGIGVPHDRHGRGVFVTLRTGASG